MKRYFFHCVFLLYSCILLGQRVELSGVVVEKSSGEPISMVHLRVGEIVTYTNEDGVFHLHVPENTSGELEVFHLGYDTESAAIDPTTSYKLELTALKPKPGPDTLTARQIMEHAFMRFPWNYEVEDQLMLSYYKEKLVDKEQIVHIAEGILEVHLPANVEKAPAMIRPIKLRVNSPVNIKHRGVKVRSGHATEMVQSSIWLKHSFLSEKNRWNYTYNLTGREIHRDEHLFIIDFEPENKKGYVTGRIWVDENSYAIVRMEYYLYNNSHFDEEKWIEEFQHHDHTYYLLRASFEGTWTEGEEEFQFTSLIVNTEVEANREDNMDWHEFTKGDRFAFPEEDTGEFNDSFWENYNYIELSKAENQQIQ